MKKLHFSFNNDKTLCGIKVNDNSTTNADEVNCIPCKNKLWNLHKPKTSSLPKWVKIGAKCFHKDYLSTISNLDDNEICVIHKGMQGWTRVDIDEIIEAVKVPLNQDNIIAETGGWVLYEREYCLIITLSENCLTIHAGGCSSKIGYKSADNFISKLDGSELCTWEHRKMKKTIPKDPGHIYLCADEIKTYQYAKPYRRRG